MYPTKEQIQEAIEQGKIIEKERNKKWNEEIEQEAESFISTLPAKILQSYEDGEHYILYNCDDNNSRKQALKLNAMKIIQKYCESMSLLTTYDCYSRMLLIACRG